MKDFNRLIEFGDRLIDMVFETNLDVINDYKKYYKKERKYIMNNFDNVPDFLKKCRSYDYFIDFLIEIDKNNDTWKQSARLYINKKYSEFLDYIEFGKKSNYNEASISNNHISIILQKEIFSHVKDLLNDGHYYSAIEESYKIVRQKLKYLTGTEKANEAFKGDIIFGHEPKDEAEKDFFEGVKFLHFAIQYLRNEKVHTPAKKIDKNLAIHYIVLASLAYDLIDNRDIEKNG